MRTGPATRSRLPDEDFDEAVRIAQAEYDEHHPDVVVGSSRGGAVAMNINSGDTPLVLLCPAWKKWGTTTTVKPNTVILHSRGDDVVPFVDSEELVRNRGLPESALIKVGADLLPELAPARLGPRANTRRQSIFRFDPACLCKWLVERNEECPVDAAVLSAASPTASESRFPSLHLFRKRSVRPVSKVVLKDPTRTSPIRFE